MPWKLTLVEPGPKGFKPTAPGEMCFAPWLEDWADLSPEYKRDWAGKRPPILINLPSESGFPSLWSPDFRCGNPNGGLKLYGWTVTGEAPNITVSPSIDRRGQYHGFVQGGLLTEDVEGRAFPGIPRTV
jgi:hypothetical protein